MVYILIRTDNVIMIYNKTMITFDLTRKVAQMATVKYRKV